MRIGMVSDTHGSLLAWRQALRVLGEVDILLHAGDVLYHGPRNPLPEGHDAGHLAMDINQYSGRLVVARGNCDAEIDQTILDVPIQDPYAIVVTGDKYIMVHHGHLTSEKGLAELMKRYKLDLVVTGHTHVPGITRPLGRESGIIVNPGSPALPKTTERRGTVGLADSNGIRILHVDDGSELMSCGWQ